MRTWPWSCRGTICLLKKNTTDTFIKYALQFHNNIQDVLKYIETKGKGQTLRKKDIQIITKRT